MAVQAECTHRFGTCRKSTGGRRPRRARDCTRTRRTPCPGAAQPEVANAVGVKKVQIMKNALREINETEKYSTAVPSVPITTAVCARKLHLAWHTEIASGKTEQFCTSSAAIMAVVAVVAVVADSATGSVGASAAELLMLTAEWADESQNQMMDVSGEPSMPSRCAHTARRLRLRRSADGSRSV